MKKKTKPAAKKQTTKTSKAKAPAAKAKTSKSSKAKAPAAKAKTAKPGKAKAPAMKAKTAKPGKAATKTSGPAPKARYVDGFVIPIPKNNIAAYQRMAQKAGKIWMEHGAIEYRECVGEDFGDGSMGSSFTTLTKLQPDETVIFAWITYKSRAQRDRINKKVMKDPRMNEIAPKEMPFDMQRMNYAGFEILVNLT